MVLCCGKGSKIFVTFELSLGKVLGGSIGINYDDEGLIPTGAAEVLRRFRRFLFYVVLFYFSHCK